MELAKSIILLYNIVMKVKELIQKYFEAIFKQNPEKEAKLYKKITKKSLKGKKTQRIK